ncbi:MAG: hypothetical protein ACKN9T_04075, partial [Candidatus Methylumidiphilus sp.]
MAGLAPAKPSRREAMSVEDMHRNLYKAHGCDLLGTGPVQQLAPGKVWQNLAGDLLMGNLECDAWGWADAGLVHLLEFWRDFDPQVRFVLAYSAPAFAVGQMLRQGLVAPGDIRQAAASWEASNVEILRFYSRNPDRCLLVNASAAVHAPAEFTAKAAAAFGLPLGGLPADWRVDWDGFSAIASSLAKGLTENCEEASALYCELESSADLDGSAVSSQEGDGLQVWREYCCLLANLEQAGAQAQAASEREMLLLAQSAEADAAHAHQANGLHVEVERLGRALDEQAAMAAAERKTLLEQADGLHAEVERLGLALDEQAAMAAAERKTLLEQADGLHA